MKKNSILTKLEIAYIATATVGVAMILCSTFFAVEEKSVLGRWLAILGDLGTGLFPTGVIGLVLEKMQNRNRERDKKSKRMAVLRLFNSAVHRYFNSICNEAIRQKNAMKGKCVFEIISSVGNEVQFECSAEEIASLCLLGEKLVEIFEKAESLFIVTDVFDPVEIDHFNLLAKETKKLLSSTNKENSIKNARCSFLSYLKTACLEIPECGDFVNMVSDGDNIYIPKA